MNFNFIIKFMGFFKVFDFGELVDDFSVDGGFLYFILVEAFYYIDVGFYDS